MMINSSHMSNSNTNKASVHRYFCCCLFFMLLRQANIGAVCFCHRTCATRMKLCLERKGGEQGSGRCLHAGRPRAGVFELYLEIYIDIFIF